MTENEEKNKCCACPRECGADRSKRAGFCGAKDCFRISRVALHEWEEPCISYGKGSGTVFFAGCSLKCVFCQNHEISCALKGRDIDSETLLCEIYRLCKAGAVNINLVNPTHYALMLCGVLKKARERVKIPFVYNTGGYDKVETLKKLEGLIDIYLPDIKYFSDEYARRYSGCGGYFDTALAAVKEMHRQSGYAEFDGEGHMKSGVLVRHLVLPGLYRDSIEIFKRLACELDASKTAVSIMSQYFPSHRAKEFPEINRRVTTLEYMRVVEAVQKLGFSTGFIQERGSANECYVPKFDY